MIVAVAAVAVAVDLAREGYQTIARDRGIAVWRRDAGSAIDLAAEGPIAAPLPRVREVLLDYANHPRWVRSVAESRVLAAGDGALDVYERLSLPMIDDRDYTLHVTWTDDAAGTTIRFSTVNERGPPPVAGVVRVRVHEGSWRIVPDGARTRALYRVRIDLRGRFVGWIGRRLAGRDLPVLFRGVGRRANRIESASDPAR